jgi:hypothetical protein
MMTPRKIALLSLALVSAGLLAAACDTVKAPKGPAPDPLSSAAYPQIVALGDLGKYLAYDKPIVRREPGQPLDITVPLRLIHDNHVHAQYRYIFFASDGTPLAPQMDWRYVELPGRTQVMAQGAALDPNAADWRLEIRPAR